MPSKSTLNEKMSDIIGETALNLNENIQYNKQFFTGSKFKRILTKIK